VKIGMPAVLITVAALATAITACSSSPSGTTANSHHGASPGITAGPKGVAVVLSSNPVCRQLQKDQKAWKTAIAEPGDESTVLLNTSTRPAWRKFGRQLEQLSQTDIGGKDPKVAARTAKDLARMGTLLTAMSIEPFRQFSGVQYQRTTTLLEDVTGDCTVLSS
jgi:hypothetical protein